MRAVLACAGYGANNSYKATDAPQRYDGANKKDKTIFNDTAHRHSLFIRSELMADSFSALRCDPDAPFGIVDGRAHLRGRRRVYDITNGSLFLLHY